MSEPISAEVLAVIVAMVDGEPCVLTLPHAPRLPAGPLLPGHRSLQTAVRAWVAAFAEALAAPGYAALCSQYGLYPFARTGAALEAFVHRSLADYRQLAQELGLRSWAR